MKLHGYKAFNNNMTNRYGNKFEEGKIYTVNGELQFGLKGNGFHFCRRLEDTLRYVDGMHAKIKIAKVTSYGDYKEYWDDYYGYYDMYAARNIIIDEILEREKIIAMYLSMSNEERVIRFIQGFRLTNEEIELFKIRFSNSSRILKAISYYQEDDKDVYTKGTKKIYSKKVI